MREKVHEARSVTGLDDWASDDPKQEGFQKCLWVLANHVPTTIIISPVVSSTNPPVWSLSRSHTHLSTRQWPGFMMHATSLWTGKPPLVVIDEIEFRYCERSRCLNSLAQDWTAAWRAPPWPRLPPYPLPRARRQPGSSARPPTD